MATVGTGDIGSIKFVIKTGECFDFEYLKEKLGLDVACQKMNYYEQHRERVIRSTSPAAGGMRVPSGNMIIQ